MLRTAALLLGLSGLWLLTTQRWGSWEDGAVAFAAACVCVAVALRTGGPSAAFARAPLVLATLAQRASLVLRGVFMTLRAALAADIALRPALMRIRTKSKGPERAAFADLLSAAPGFAVVDSDADSLLIHVMNEPASDPNAIARLERLVGAVGGEQGA